MSERAILKHATSQNFRQKEMLKKQKETIEFNLALISFLKYHLFYIFKVGKRSAKKEQN
jgi:hypothetical protein